MKTKMLIFYTIHIFNFFSPIIKCSETCEYKNCYDCSVCGDVEDDYCTCQWDNETSKCLVSANTINIKQNSFWTYFDSCTDTSSLAIRDKYCGEYEVSLDSNNVAKISFQNVDGVFGLKNLYCNYSFTANDNQKATDYYELKAEFTTNISKKATIYIIITYNDNTKTVGTIDEDLDKELIEVKSIEVKIYTSRTFYENPFTLQIIKEKEKKSYTIYYALAAIILSCALCGLLIYCFSKRISESARIRQRALLEMAMQRQQRRELENGTDRPLSRGESQASEEDILEQNFKKIEVLLKTTLAPKKYHKNMGLKDGTNCTICIEKFKNNKSKVSITSCGHIFHYKCLSNWLTKNVVNPKCPNCNHNLLQDVKIENLLETNNVEQSHEIVNINRRETINVNNAPVGNNNIQNEELPETNVPTRAISRSSVGNQNLRFTRNRHQNLFSQANTNEGENNNAASHNREISNHRNNNSNNSNNNSNNNANNNNANNNNANNNNVNNGNNNDTDNIEEIVIAPNGGN